MNRPEHRRLLILVRSGPSGDLHRDYEVPNPGSTRLSLNGARRYRSQLRPERRAFQRRIEAAARRVGPYMISDDPFLYTWESTLGEPGRGSIVTTYFGGRSGAAGQPARRAHAPTVKRERERNLASLSQDGAAGLGGLRRGFNGRAWTDRWVADPWARGSYAAYLPGQYTRYYGYVGKPEGAIHFAGEHTATTHQGYLEGAVESGERAAEEIVAAAGT